MNSSNWVAVISVISTAAASIYSTHTQLGIEDIRQDYELKKMELTHKIEQRKEQCIKIEAAMQDLNNLNLELSRTEASDNRKVYEIKMKALSYVYLVDETRIDEIKNAEGDSGFRPSIFIGHFISAYNKCKVR